MPPSISWEERALAAEKTVAVLVRKVRGLYAGTEKTTIQRQLEQAQRRSESVERRRELADVRNAELKRHAEGLEREVAERTRDVRTILDNVSFGFLLVGSDSRVVGDYSKSCHALLASTELAGRPLAEVLGAGASRQRIMLEAGIDQVFEDIMPEELSLGQLPSRYVLGARTLSISGAAVRDEAGAVYRILVTISDITELETAQREMRHHRLLVNILRQKEWFRILLAEFFSQLGAARAAIVSGDQVTVRRAVHTIKGNMATCGLDVIAKTAHEIEENDTIQEAHLALLESSAREFLTENADVLGFLSEGAQSFQVTEERVSGLEHIIERFPEAMQKDAKRWLAETKLVPFQRLMGPFVQLAKGLSERLEKPAEFTVSGEDTLVDATAAAPIIAVLPHLVRNAFDHGLEQPDERGDKPSLGHIGLHIAEGINDWHVAVSDDGRGIRAADVAARAVAMGILDAEAAAAMPDADKMQLIFEDRLSTAAETTEISGRGVGMGAVLAAVRQAGGDVTVESVPGEGTTIRMLIPKPAVLNVARGLSGQPGRYVARESVQ
jgi:two-component system, chemotaxis family, sensor kinase CheA